MSLSPHHCLVSHSLQDSPGPLFDPYFHPALSLLKAVSHITFPGLSCVIPGLQAGLCANEHVMVSVQDELSDVEPKAAVQGLQATGSPQKQLCAPQEHHGHGE